MTNEETINALKYINLSRVHPFLDWEEMKEVRDMAISALGKQIPKKPILNDELFLGEKVKMPYCPNCGDSWNRNEFGNGMEHCWSCGQAIDWSDM